MSNDKPTERSVSQEVLLAVGELKGLMIGIQNQLASGSKRMDEQDIEISNVRTELTQAHKETSDRVSAVERKQAKYAGAITLLSILITVAGIALPLIF